MYLFALITVQSSLLASLIRTLEIYFSFRIIIQPSRPESNWKLLSPVDITSDYVIAYAASCFMLWSGHLLAPTELPVLIIPQSLTYRIHSAALSVLIVPSGVKLGRFKTDKKPTRQIFVNERTEARVWGGPCARLSCCRLYFVPLCLGMKACLKTTKLRSAEREASLSLFCSFEESAECLIPFFFLPPSPLLCG